jgi:hypothetical protein
MLTDKPFVIFSSITEDKGHLILDDLFWFSNLVHKFSQTRIITSENSAKNLQNKYPSFIENISSFKDYSFLKRINYRLHILLRLISCEKIKNSRIIFQGFDEFGILFYFLRILGQNNIVYVVPTNNVSPERLNKSKWLLQWMLKKIISNSDRFLYHTDFELALVKSKISNSPNFLEKCYKLKYHLIGQNCNTVASENKNSEAIISFFGPTMSSKPILDFCNLMKADNFAKGKFHYRIINVSNQVKEELISVFGNKNNIYFLNEYLEHEEYIKLINSSRYVFLPHNLLFEGKLSGIFSDCISNNTPIISNNIEPVLEFFKKYGAMGFVFEFSLNVDWRLTFLNNQNDDEYQLYKTSLLNCKNDHNHDNIINEFINIIE